MARGRISVLVFLSVTVAAVHWLMPTDTVHFHTLHLLMRKLFLFPVVLAAVWFGLRGGMVSAATVTLLYLPHIAFQWSGRLLENLNQLGEIGSVWMVAGIAGLLVSRLQKARQTALEPFQGRLNALIEALDKQLGHQDPMEAQRE